MRVAVIGLGVIGQLHVKVIQETKNDLVAVCDVDIEKFVDYAGVKCYTDYLVMLDEVKPDVIHICTPHYLHTEMIIAGLQRNINVLCEKPLCIDEKDIPLIMEAERNSKAQLGVCFQNRYNPSSVFVKEYLQGKKIVGAHGNQEIFSITRVEKIAQIQVAEHLERTKRTKLIANNNIVNNLPAINTSSVDYRLLDIPNDSLIFCDPPYKDSTVKYNDQKFNYEEFYDWCLEKAKNNQVLVTEYNIDHPHFHLIGEKGRQISLNGQGSKGIKIERLYKVIP